MRMINTVRRLRAQRFAKDLSPRFVACWKNEWKVEEIRSTLPN